MRQTNEPVFFINTPVFVKYKTRGWGPTRRRYLKSAVINERIVEQPFALAHLSRLAPGARILDVGCTESDVPLKLASLGYRVVGVDVRVYPYRHPLMSFVRADLCALPFCNEAFDGVAAISTIEHVGLGFYQDPKHIQDADVRAVTEIRRVMKRGGVLVLTVPAGQAATAHHQRVYDAIGVERLMQGFDVIDKRWFRLQQDGAFPYGAWIETDAKQILTIDSRGRTQAVCVIAAIKRG